MSNIELWRGEFGDEYTERQEFHDPYPTLRRILGTAWDEINTVLEVGCNRGDNLARLSREKHVQGTEPNEDAARLARQWGITVWNWPAQAINQPDGHYDLVFTAGVLIHIADSELDRALYEIHRVSRRFILSIEYPGDGPIEYRGNKNGIWKRVYAGVWLDRYPLNLIGHGDESSLDGTPYEGAGWWLFDKRPPIGLQSRAQE